MKTTLVAIAVIASLLGSCAEKQINEMTYPEIIALGGKIRDRCFKEAGPAGTAAFQSCVDLYARQEVSRRQQSAIDAQNARIAIGSGLAAGAQGMASSYNAAAAQPVYRPPTMCTSNVMGATTSNPTLNTTCY